MWDFLVVLMIGLLTGMVAYGLKKRPHGFHMSVTLAISGAWIGGFLTNLVDFPVIRTGLLHWGFEITTAMLSAVAVLSVVGLFRDGSTQA